MDKRIVSIDVLRGMTIFFMIVVNSPGSWSNVYAPLLHAKWHGCTPTDLVFPFFLFIVGVSMYFSFLKYKKEFRAQWIQKVVKRTALIFLVGLLLNWFPFFNTHISNLRIFGVLQRIAMAFGGAGLLIILFRKQNLLILISAIILLAYWGLLYAFGGDAPYALESNLCTQIDFWLLGENHIYKGFGIPFDPEGLASSLPGIAHVIIGYLIGLTIHTNAENKQKLLYKLASIGILLVALGQLWGSYFPINKPFWTSSYVLYTIGLATLLLTALTYVLDIRKWISWAYPFRVFGLNPLVSYVLSILIIKVSIYIIKIDGTSLYGWLYTNVFINVIDPKFGSFLQAFSLAALVWVFAWLLYRKGKVIKL